MEVGFLVEEAVNKRYSVRTFDKRAVEQKVREQLLKYAAKLKNPLGPQINVKFIETSASSDGEKLGTYGVIKGANLYLGVTVPDEEGALEALGYDFEQLVLYATSLGLGTCWLGGTYNKSEFAKAMQVKDNEIFTIISPVGYPAARKRIAETLFRGGLGADKRLPWEKLFFANDFETPLSKDAAGEYAFSLEMLRLAPSAVNKQPWRVVFDGKAFHFFEKSSLDAEAGAVDIQRIDIGIAICHFHLAAMERGLCGRFEKAVPVDVAILDNTTYVISWILGEK